VTPDAVGTKQKVVVPWTPWWQGTTLYDGVFKGGGGKGILYVGALEEVAASGRWFRAVAGSSAGAITAMLVASGFAPDRLAQLALDGSGKVNLFLPGDLLGQPLLRTGRLRSWLDEELRKQLELIGSSPPSDAPIRFIDLAPTGIELFVVCVDVVRRQPRVFGTTLTPEIEIVDAVIASCAIPFVFRQGRLEVQAGAGLSEVHRLIDGGVWANYPAFVFRDSSFRAYHGLGAPEPERTLGFAIEREGTDPPQPLHVLSTWGPAHSRRDRGAATGSSPFVAWGLLRFYLFFVLPLIFVFMMIDLVRDKGLVTWREVAFQMPPLLEGIMGFIGGFQTLGTLGQWILYALMGATVCFVLVMAVLGFTILDTGRATIRTLTSVGTAVPYWVGTASNDRVIKLAPPPGLGTLTFRLKPDQAADCIAAAREQTSQQLTRLFPQPP
jgi:predicted acylesterase/phospholipase RssA